MLTIYKCQACGAEYSDKEEAEKCEKRPITKYYDKGYLVGRLHFRVYVIENRFAYKQKRLLVDNKQTPGLGRFIDLCLAWKRKKYHLCVYRLHNQK
jgi:hypothetical protein